MAGLQKIIMDIFYLKLSDKQAKKRRKWPSIHEFYGKKLLKTISREDESSEMSTCQTDYKPYPDELVLKMMHYFFYLPNNQLKLHK